MHGLGDRRAKIAVYTQNVPPMSPYSSRRIVHPVNQGDITSINHQCGNGWRKLFNVYAKLVFAMKWQELDIEQQCWQDYRDEKLLQPGSGLQLLFSVPEQITKDKLHIIMGKHFARGTWLAEEFCWIDSQFAILPNYPLIVCPYFDYRQLTNSHIVQLVKYIQQYCLPIINDFTRCRIA